MAAEKGLLDSGVTIAYTIFTVFSVPLILANSGLQVSLLSILTIAAIVTCAWLLGAATGKLSPLIPALLGQLIVGLLSRTFLLNNINDANQGNSTSSTYHPVHVLSADHATFHSTFASTSTALRDLAMAVLVMRAGLGFDLDALKRVATTCIFLTILPCTGEILVCCGLAHLLLGWTGLSLGNSILWGAMMGCVLGAVTPAVIVPAVEDLKARGLAKTETQSSIVNLIVAASSFDDVLAISLFTVLLSIAVAGTGGSGGTMAMIWAFTKGPIFVVFGVVFGYVLALALVKTMAKSTTFRVFLALTLPYMLNQGSIVLDISSAGPVGCILFGLTAARQIPEIFHDTAKTLDVLWLVLEPAMFSLIGCELDLFKFSGPQLFKLCVLLLAALTFRTLIAYLVAHMSKQFTWKQSLFIAIAWLPKATVQAAIGTTAVVRLADMADKSSDLFKAKAKAADDIVAIAVLSILLTAPTGAFLIRFLSDKLLADPAGNDREEGRDENNKLASSH